jgi:hypothetical protein
MEELPTSSQNRLVKGGDCHLGEAAIRLQRSLGDTRSPITQVCSRHYVIFRFEAFSLSDSKTISLQSIRLSARFDSLDQQTQLIISALLDHNRGITNEIREIRTQTLALAQLVSRLEVVNGDWNRENRAMIANKLKPRRGDHIRGISAKIEVLAISPQEENRQRLHVQDAILTRLQYPTMTHRYEQVLEAYRRTLDWVFHPEKSKQLPWSNFVDWLENSGGVYWVNGKAGSGKSTLMKYILEDPRTQQHLRVWAGNLPLCCATFFFWNSGTPEQKSQSGLLRALLYEILQQYPDLIPIVLPQPWASSYSWSVGYCWKPPVESYSLRQLQDAFTALIQQTSVPLKLCLFIDGLDEFDGDHEEVALLFKNVTTVTNVKVCLSSRPWVVFQDLFRSCSSLRLQDLTRGDIEYYVSDRMQSSSAFQSLVAREPEAASGLIQEVVQKADGVFLWVRIVVTSLMNGIRNRDGLQDLQKRLQLLPKELEPLYEHLLSLIEPVYLEWASKAFQLARAVRKHHNYMNGSGETTGPLRVLELYLALAEGMSVEEIPTFNSQALIACCKDIEIQLTARCGGFLEVWARGPHWITTEVQYLHRTARDFIERSDIWNRFLEHTKNTSFNPAVSMLKSCVLLLALQRRDRALPGVRFRPERTQQLATSAMIYAHYANARTQNPPTMILDQLENDLALYPNLYRLNMSRWRHILENRAGSINTGPASILHLAIMYNLTDYVAEKTSQGSQPASLLHFVATLEETPEESEKRVFPPPSARMVSLLLENGGDPNARYFDSPSAWEKALRCISHFRPDFRANIEERREYLRILLLLIKAGARTADNLLCADHQKHPAMWIIMTSHLEDLPTEKAELISALRVREAKLVEASTNSSTRSLPQKRDLHPPASPESQPPKRFRG